jgi:electron transport complex protein RnfD
MLDKQVVVSSSPHVRSDDTTEKIMWQVTLALVPAALVGIYFFGLYALVVISVSVLAAVITEYLTGRMMGRPLSIKDGSAVLTGLLLALVIPPGVPLWIPAIGSAFAIAIGKQVFGGLGYNPLNPALLGRAVLLASWPTLMTTWKWPTGSLGWLHGVDGTAGASATIDAIAGATALGLHKQGVLAELGAQIPYSQLFIGNISGSLGETSALALLIGAAFLIYKKIIDPRIPLTFIGTVIVLSALFGQDPLFHVLAGGLVLGAFFMATDYVTTPVTPRGKLIFGFGCGLLTMLIRRFGGYPEGVCYSILIMNTATPLLDRYTRPRRFGEVQARG